MLIQAELKKLLDYNPITGVFTWSTNRVCVSVGDVAGHISKSGYSTIRIKGVLYFAHRLAWLYVYNEWPDNIDHINHNRSDNKIKNLRSVSHKNNLRNMSLSISNTSGVTGVYWDKKKKSWMALIMIDGKSKFLGYSKDKFEVICYRKSANNKYGFHENHGN